MLKSGATQDLSTKICTIQKRAIRIIHNVWYHEHKNTFLKKSVIKFMDLVQFKLKFILSADSHYVYIHVLLYRIRISLCR